ncbi:MAG: glycosyltransferase family 1 protein [Chloroflexi bacterium]|nr:MAG: glycosyltransferase family 1 protein [Chloroflexota bacterium]
MLSPTMFFADYGAHVRILEETLALQKRGHRVTILAYPNGRDIAGISVRRCWGVPFNYRVIVGSSRHKIYLDVLLAGMTLLHGLRHRPDIIHAHLHEGALMGWVLSKLTGAPLVFDFQGSLTSEMIDHNFLSPSSPFYRVLYWLETRLDHAADVVLTSTVHASRLLIDRFRVPPTRVDPTPDCVNADTFNRQNFSAAEIDRLKAELGVPPGKKVIVYLGVLTTYQGIDKLLEAVDILRRQRDDFHLLLMGYPGVVRYSQMARQMGIDHLVTFTGKIPYEDAPRYLALGDLAAAPKLSATEGSGKILNYMAMGLPTVAFSLPVSREFLSDGGIYAAETTSHSLADALRRALDMTAEERTRLGQHLRQRVIRHYNWDRAAEQIEAIYHALLSGEPLPVLAVRKARIP